MAIDRTELDNLCDEIEELIQRKTGCYISDLNIAAAVSVLGSMLMHVREMDKSKFLKLKKHIFDSYSMLNDDIPEVLN